MSAGLAKEWWFGCAKLQPQQRTQGGKLAHSHSFIDAIAKKKFTAHQLANCLAEGPMVQGARQDCWNALGPVQTELMSRVPMAGDFLRN